MSDKSWLVFNQVNIVSGDTEASLRFYRALGMEIPDSAVWRTQTGAHHITAQKASGGLDASLDIDSTTFASHWNGAWKGWPDMQVMGRVVIGFEVESRERVDTLYAAMEAAGYRGLQPPYDALWGARYAIIEDPDGVAVGVMSPASPEFGSAPPKI